MSRTIIIAHTDWSGPRPDWVRQPFLDGGRLKFDRSHRPDWDNVWYELGTLARVHGVAIGCRGTYDPPAVACLPIARAAYNAASLKPTVTFWADTVGLPDIAHNLSGSAFDFANPQHIHWGWEHFVKHFVDHFGDAPLERVDGKVLLPWWGIASNTGHGFHNQQEAQRLLDYVDQQLAARGLGVAAHIVDTTWLKYAPTLQVYGVHNWFNPWGTVPQSYSVRTHNGVTVGVVVPGFSDPNAPLPERIPAHGADTARAGLAACREAGCEVVILEGATNFTEGAEWMRDARGSSAKLAAVSAHIQLTAPNEPDPPEPAPFPGGRMQLAVTVDPILRWRTGVLVSSPLGANRYALRWTQPPGQAGYPDPSSSRFLCLNPDGSTEAKDAIGEWESSQPVQPGDVEVRWFTINAGEDQSAALVFGLQQFSA